MSSGDSRTDEQRSEYGRLPAIQRPQWWRVSVTSLLFAFAFTLQIRTYADNDLWGHLRFGLDMVKEQRLVFADSYSYVTEGQLWINHEWLTELAMAGAWLAAASAGLVALLIIVTSAMLGLLYHHLTRRLHLSHRPSLVILFLAIAGLIPFLTVVRPQMFTYLLFTVTMIVIYQAESGRYRWLWVMPVVIALWTNLHGGVLAGLGVFGVWTALHLVQHLDQWRAVLPPALVTVAALLLNPYGVVLPVFLLRTATVPRPEITEWRPIIIFSYHGVVYLTLLAVSAFALLASRAACRKNLLILFAVTVLLPLTAMRHLPLMAIAFTVVVGEHFASAWQHRLGWLTRVTTLHTRSRILPVTPLVIALLLMGAAIIQNRGRLMIADVTPFPSAAVTLLKNSGFQGNLATMFNWGEYIIWHAGPEVQVSIDGRRETVYSPEIYRQNFDLWEGRNDWAALLRDHPTDAALIDRGSAADNLMRLSPKWLLVYEDESSALFVNESSEAAQVIKEAAPDFQAPEPSLYFP